MIDIGEGVSGTFKKVVNVFSSDKATQISLLPFELKAFKITKI